MLLIPKALYAQYLQYLTKNNVDGAIFQEYLKWLRYYLDFCAKHLTKEDTTERMRFCSWINSGKRTRVTISAAVLPMPYRAIWP